MEAIGLITQAARYHHKLQHCSTLNGGLRASRFGDLKHTGFERRSRVSLLIFEGLNVDRSGSKAFVSTMLSTSDLYGHGGNLDRMVTPEFER
jgi:hypothetical protein